MSHQIIFEAEVAVPEGLEQQFRQVICATLEAENVTEDCEVNVLVRH